MLLQIFDLFVAHTIFSTSWIISFVYKKKETAIFFSHRKKEIKNTLKMLAICCKINNVSKIRIENSSKKSVPNSPKKQLHFVA